MSYEMNSTELNGLKNRTALICGVSSQDGSYLAQLLLQKGYKVFGTSRDAQGLSFSNLKKLGIEGQVSYISMIPEDFRSVLVALRKSNPANETTPLYPMSPYAVAKSSAYWLVNNYRNAYGLFACAGNLFNHESSLRPERFVTQKIVRAVKRIAQGSKEQLRLVRLDIARDWGWAPEYVEAMWLMLQQDKPVDLVIATGTTITLEEFVKTAFEQANLNCRDFVIQDPALFCPTELAIGRANPRKANQALAWKASTQGVGVAKRMFQSL